MAKIDPTTGWLMMSRREYVCRVLAAAISGGMFIYCIGPLFGP